MMMRRIIINNVLYQFMINKKITFTCIYINNDDKITNVLKEDLSLQTENIVSRTELIDIIKKYSFFLEKRYTVLSILKYNITGLELDVYDVYLSGDEDDGDGDENGDGDVNLSEEEEEEEDDEDPNFLTIIKNIEDICFENTSSVFQDLNEIIILFNEKNDIADININKKPSFALTKRVYINKKHNYKRTHRHRNIRP